MQYHSLVRIGEPTKNLLELALAEITAVGSHIPHSLIPHPLFLMPPGMLALCPALAFESLLLSEIYHFPSHIITQAVPQPPEPCGSLRVRNRPAGSGVTACRLALVFSPCVLVHCRLLLVFLLRTMSERVFHPGLGSPPLPFLCEFVLNS